MTRRTTDRTTEPTTGPTPGPTTGPNTGPTAEPVRRSAVEPARRPPTEPVMTSATRPVTKTAAGPGTGPGTASARDPVPHSSTLYVIVCGSPVARTVSDVVTLGQADGWDVCVVATPSGRKFLDVPAVAAQTGHPVRSEYKNPGEPDLLPPADAMLVAPATVNTVTKWAAGIADTLALGLLVEAYGKGLPIVAMPFTNQIMATHPAFQTALRTLREWGVDVLYGDDVVKLPEPGRSEQAAAAFPWQLALDVLRSRKPRRRADRP